MKKIATLLVAVIFTLGLFGCSSGPKFLKDKDLVTDVENIEGQINLEQDGRAFSVSFVLYYKKAPNTVTNFVQLAANGFYNDLVVDANSSDYTSMGTKNIDYAIVDDKPQSFLSLVTKETKYTISGEFKDNDWTKNDIALEDGVMFMLQNEANNFNSITSGFAISHSTDYAKSLKGKIATFGKITSTSITSGTFSFTHTSDYDDYIKIKSVTFKDKATTDKIVAAKLAKTKTK